MSDAALEAQGMTLAIQTASGPAVYTTIAEVKRISGPGGSAPVKDTTALTDSAKYKRMGLMDEGQLQFTIQYVPDDTTHTLLRTKRQARTLTSFKLTFTDAGPTTWTFNAYVAGFQLEGIEVDGIVTAQVTLEISGLITEA